MNHIDHTIANLRAYFALKIPNYDQGQLAVPSTPSSSHRPEQPWMTGAELTAIARFLEINIAFFDATGPGWRYYRSGGDEQGRNLGDFNPFSQVEMEQPTIFIYGNNIHYQSINISSNDAIWQQPNPELRAQVNHDLVMARYDQVAKQREQLGQLGLQALDRQKKSTQGYLNTLSDAAGRSLAALSGLGGEIAKMSSQDIRAMAVEDAAVQASLDQSTPTTTKNLDLPSSLASRNPRSNLKQAGVSSGLPHRMKRAADLRRKKAKATIKMSRLEFEQTSEMLQAIKDGEIIMETEEKPEGSTAKYDPNKARRSRWRTSASSIGSMKAILDRLQRSTPPGVVARLSAEDAARFKRVIDYLKSRLGFKGGKSKKRRHRRRKTRREKKRRKRKTIRKRRKRGRKTRRK